MKKNERKKLILKIIALAIALIMISAIVLDLFIW